MRAAIAGVIALAAAAVPHAFTPGTTAKSAEVNANFSALDTALTTVSADLASLQTQVGALTTVAPGTVLTADSDIDQSESGEASSGMQVTCTACGRIYRLTSGPFILTNTEHLIPPRVCIAPCSTLVGRIFYFPAPDDAAAAAIAASTAVPRWNWQSIAYEGDMYSNQTGVALRLAVKRGEYLYAHHLPGSRPPVGGETVPDYEYTSASTGYWSGYHPY